MAGIIRRLLRSSIGVQIGAAPATTGALRLANAGTIKARNAANTADLTMLTTTTSDRLEVGQSANPVVIMPDRLVMQLATSAGASIKRSSTTLEARLGDDSDYARFRAAALILSDVISPSALTVGNNNNYNPSGLSTAFALRLSGDAAGSNLTGITVQESGRLLLLINISANQITIVDESTASTAANRILTKSGGNVALGPTSNTVMLWYDTASARWREIS